MSKKKIDEAELREFMSNMGPDTKVYFGCDSERFKMNGKWFADYMVVIVVHINGFQGCKIFAEVSREADYDEKAARPFNRMMTEARKVADLHNKFKDVFEDYEVYIHLDCNPKKTAGSSVAAEAAAGYVKGMTNVVPLLKPLAFAASYAADRAKDVTGASAYNV
jgi:predicted RNase H-related nuclease YkuK (DUF458 family)